jgi:glutaminyl-peptide cyclotransferase
LPDRGERIMAEVTSQVALGPRAPGLPGHAALRRKLQRRLEQWADEVRVQEFTVQLPAGPAACVNLAGVFRGGRQGNGGLLLGSHFDTRLRADRESDPRLRGQPIPGANDGGSGTAVLLDLLPDLAQASRTGTLGRDVTVVFFDAEDIGEIAGYPFSYGARRFVAQSPVPRPAEAIVLDMIGGRDLLLDLDAHALHHGPSWALTGRLFGLGAQLAGRAFSALSHGGGSAAALRSGEPPSKLRYIVCDQIPFLQAGIATCLLIDLHYPEWHTQADLPEAMDAGALAVISEVLRRFVPGLEG